MDFNITGNLAAAVQFLARSSSLANALGNNDANVKSQLYSPSNPVVTASTTASNQPSPDIAEYKDGPTLSTREGPSIASNVVSNSAYGVGDSSASSSTITVNPISPFDPVASSSQAIPDPLNIGDEEAMELDSSTEEDNESVKVKDSMSLQPADNLPNPGRVPDSAIELGKRFYNQPNTTAPAVCGSSSDGTAKRVRLSLSDSPTSSSSSLDEAEAFLDSVASKISPTSRSPENGAEESFDATVFVESHITTNEEPQASMENLSSTNGRSTSRSEREARIWDGEHPEVENPVVLDKVRRASGVWEVNEKETGELSETSPATETLPAVDTDAVRPSNEPTSTTDIINTPGIWSLHAGLDSLGFLPTELDVDENISSRVQQWARQSREGAISLSADEPLPFIVYLFCLPVPAVQAMAENVPAELESEMWMSTSYGDECMNRAEKEGACVWPERGLCIEVNGKAAGVIGGKVIKNPNPSSPLDISRHILPGRNTFRLVQLQDLSDFVFIIFCREARDDDLQRHAKNPRTKDDEVLEKIRSIAKRAKERMRREREEGGRAGSTLESTSAQVVGVGVA